MTTFWNIQTLLDAARNQWRAAAIRRRQRLALGDLLGMSPARLDDLGLSRHDVIEAIAAARRAGTDLDIRREQNTARKPALGNARASGRSRRGAATSRPGGTARSVPSWP